MSFLRKTIYLLLSLPLLLGAAACSNDDPVAPGEAPEDDDTKSYLEIAVIPGGQQLGSRAVTPAGGEDGDGFDDGLKNENNIYNLSIFVYEDINGDGIDGDYPFVWRRYVFTDPPQGSNITSIYRVKIPLEKEDIEKLSPKNKVGTMRAIVIANAGDILTENHSSTKKLRTSLEYPKAWHPGYTVATSDYFLMSSAFNRPSDGIINQDNNADVNFYDCTVNLERVAARIDLNVSKTDNIKTGTDGKKYLQYTVKGETGNTLKLMNAIPVNLMQQKSYLIKQVSPDADEGNNYFDSETWLTAGDETTEDNIPTNYVLTPQFSLKFAADATLLKEWFGDTRASYLRDEANRNKLPLLSPLDDATIGTCDADGNIILTYANENTQPCALQVTDEVNKRYASDYLTGLLLRAQYHPATVYTTGDLKGFKDYQDGADLWMFRLVGDNVSEKATLYFSNGGALEAYVNNLPGGKEDNRRYETAYYKGGICYYTVWIKHANIDDDSNIPMKYGIVRNNIYRLSFEFNGIGLPTPDITEPRHITTRVYVKKWNFWSHPEIIM